MKLKSVEEITWRCSKCNFRSLRAWFEIHFETGVCNPQDFWYIAELDVWQHKDTTDAVNAQAVFEVLRWEESRPERKRNNPILKRGDNTRYWIDVALEKLIEDNGSRKALMMQSTENEERLEILRLRLTLLRTQLLQYLDECDVDALDGVQFLEDTEVIVEKLMTELAFEWGCSITYKG